MEPNDFTYPPSFTLARLALTLRATSKFRLPPFSGQTWRGGFGTVFRRAVCVQPKQECAQCLLRERCAYPFVFESFPHEEAARLRNYQDIPRPFVIEPPLPPLFRISDFGFRNATRQPLLPFHPGDGFSVGLILFGRAIDFLPYFIVTFLELGQAGIGKDRGQYELVRIEADRPDGPVSVYDGADGKLRDVHAARPASELAAALSAHLHPLTPSPPHQLTNSPPHQLTLRFLTPTRIRLKDDFVKPIEFHHLIRALLHRVSALCYFYGGAPLDWPYRNLIAAAEAVRIAADQTWWSDLERYSTRQETWMKIGGVVGETTYEGDMAPFLPLLAVGEWTHVGKLAVMGLGKFEVVGS